MQLRENYFEETFFEKDLIFSEELYVIVEQLKNIFQFDHT